MNLKSKLLLPSSDIQNEKFVLFGVPEADIKTVIDEVKMDDLFRFATLIYLKWIRGGKLYLNKALTTLSQFPSV